MQSSPNRVAPKREVLVNRSVQVKPLEQVIASPAFWLMDFNLRETAEGEAQTTDINFLGHYGDRIQLATNAVSGSYLSPAHDWAMLANPKELTVAADLNGGQISAEVETSEDGFKSVRAQTRLSVRDGVRVYSLRGLRGHAVRVRFELFRQRGADASPSVDGFRLVCPGQTGMAAPPALEN